MTWGRSPGGRGGPGVPASASRLPKLGDHVIGEAVVSTRPGLRGQRLRPFKSSPCRSKKELPTQRANQESS